MTRALLILVGMIFLYVVNLSSVWAQTTPSLQCGDIIEGEVTTQSSEIPYGHADRYQLTIPAGTKINLTVTPLGDTFNVTIALTDQGGSDVFNANKATNGKAEAIFDLQLASSNQSLNVMGSAPGSTVDDPSLTAIYANTNGYAGRFFGAYEIRLGCVLRDGTVIEPGDSLDQSGSANVQPTPEFSGFGFPGLPSIDFASAFRLPLTVGSANAGEIPPSGDAVLGFKFNGTAGDAVDLSFERTAGSLNLGLVVLSAENQVAFMSALVSSTTLNTQFTLPSTSEYTIGIFRIELIPPATAEATGFTITATLNP